MANAAVGDEQRGEDPTVNRLCARVARLLGKKAAMFLPSGIMCNHIAILVHCRPGDEILIAENSHIIQSEGAGAAVLAGASIKGIPAPHGIFSADDVTKAICARKLRSPHSRLIVVEQTNNRGGGSVWPLDIIEQVAEVAQTHQLKIHMDGARLMNAVVATGVSASTFAEPFDSVWLGLSKGLGCPGGAVLAGSKGFISKAWAWKHRLGGAMRQSGILAAAGLYALSHHVAHLAEDHANARVFANRIAKIPGVSLDPSRVQTNLVFFDIERTGLKATDLATQLLNRGIRIGVESEYRFRAVTHRDVDRMAILEAADALAEIILTTQPRKPLFMLNDQHVKSGVPRISGAKTA